MVIAQVLLILVNTNHEKHFVERIDQNCSGSADARSQCHGVAVSAYGVKNSPNAWFGGSGMQFGQLKRREFITRRP
jgi:hypothetical protein